MPPPSRKRPAEGPAPGTPPPRRSPEEIAALMNAMPPAPTPDSIVWSDKVDKSMAIIGSHFAKWERNPALLTQCISHDRTLLSKRSDLVRLLNRIDTLLDRLEVQCHAPCLESCPASKTTAHVAVNTSDLPLVAPAVVHKSTSTEPPDEPMTIDRTPSPVPRTYASVAVGTLATPVPKPTDPKPSQNTRSKPKGLGLAPARSAAPPVRLIVRPGPSQKASQMPFAALFIRGPTEPFRLLSHALSLNPATKDIKLLGVHQNHNKNLVVSLAPGTPDADMAKAIPIIQSVLAPYNLTPTVDRDIPWSKLLISSVPARPEPSAPVHPEADVQASFLLNPSILALKITRQPRWIRNPASITGTHSSFTFSFEDPDGLLARQLGKSSLFIFGVPVHLKRWVDKPLAKRKEARRRSRSSD